MSFPLDSTDLAAIRLTLELATLTTLLLLLLGTPVAWWLARTRSRLKGPVAAVVALPLVGGTAQAAPASAPAATAPSATAAPGSVDDGVIRILLFYKPNFHASNVEARAAIRSLADQLGTEYSQPVEIQETDDPAVFTPENLATKDALAFMQTGGVLFNEAQRRAQARARRNRASVLRQDDWIEKYLPGT